MHWHVARDRVYLSERYSYFYDLELKHFLEDFTFYHKHMPQNAKNILELGCGTGRLTIALAKRGYYVTGIDISHSMVKAAVKRYKATDRQTHLHLVRMDMTELAFRTCFDAILVPYNTLNLLTDVTTLKRCLRLSRQYLKQDGRIMMEVFTPDKKHWSLSGKRLLQFGIFRSSDGTAVQKEISRGYDPETCLLDMHETYRVYEKDQKAPKEAYHCKFQLIGLSKERWEDIVAESGFIIEAVYGDYALNPHVPGGSSKMLIVAKPGDAQEG